jgi:hypothetical protein
MVQGRRDDQIHRLKRVLKMNLKRILKALILMLLILGLN